jgi:hypothetical protein
MTGHGFPALASTALNELGYRPDVIERQLAHTEKERSAGRISSRPVSRRAADGDAAVALRHILSARAAPSQNAN